MQSMLDSIRFFANSENSVRVFEELTDGPTTSSDLAEQSGASRSTVARILDEGDSRGWIDSQGSRYELTAVGEIMIEEFRDHLATIEGVQHLGDAIEWLPQPARALDFRHFRDADIVTPTVENPAAPYDRGLELIRAADEYRGLTATAIPRYVRAIRDGHVHGRLDTEHVIAASFIELLRDDPKRAEPWHDLAETKWVYDGPVPINFHIVDERVLIWLDGPDEHEPDLRGLLESANQSVVSWAESLFDEHQAEADRLDPAVLPE